MHSRGKQEPDQPGSGRKAARAKRPPKQQELYDRLDELFAAVSGGTPVAQALREIGCDWRTFSRLCEAEVDVLTGYKAATDALLMHWAAEVVTIADAMGKDVLTDAEGKLYGNGVAVARDRLRVDSRRWLLSKLKPERYGDKIDITTDGKEIPYPVVAMPQLDPRR